MTLHEELDALHHDAARVDRSDRGAVLVTGPDALSFLQALVSADLDPLVDGDGTHCLLLSPQGKLDVDFRLLRVADDAWLDCEPGVGEQLAASLNRFRIRVRAEVVNRSGNWPVSSFIGPRALARFRAETGLDVPDVVHRHVPFGEARVVRTQWAGVPGIDVVGPVEPADLGVWPPVGATAFEAYRIESGIPRQPLDLDDKTIPQEAFLERDAVSFTKGCFLGQELVCRIDTRGHVNRFLRRFTHIVGEWPPPGAEVVAGGKTVGVLTSVAPAELPTGALGYVRREVEPPAEVDVRWPDGMARARVEELTLGVSE